MGSEMCIRDSVRIASSEGRVVIVLVTWDTRGFSRAFVAVPVWKDNVNVTSRIIVKVAHIVGGSHLGV